MYRAHIHTCGACMVGIGLQGVYGGKVHLCEEGWRLKGRAYRKGKPRD